MACFHASHERMATAYKQSRNKSIVSQLEVSGNTVIGPKAVNGSQQKVDAPTHRKKRMRSQDIRLRRRQKVRNLMSTTISTMINTLMD